MHLARQKISLGINIPCSIYYPDSKMGSFSFQIFAVADIWPIFEPPVTWFDLKLGQHHPSHVMYIPIPQIFDILIFWHYMSIWRSNFCLFWSWLKFSLPNAAKEWFCKLFADDCKIFGAVGDGWRIKSRSIRFFKPGRMVEDLATTLHCKKCNPRTQERTLSTTKIWNPLLQKRI